MDVPGREVLAHLTDGTTSVVVVGDGGMPEIAFWGAALGSADLDPALFVRPVVGGGLDVDPPVGLVTEASAGWFGRAGIEVYRQGGRDAAPRFRVTSCEADSARFVVELDDVHAALHLSVELSLDAAGVLTAAAALRNDGPDPLHVEALRISLPLPERAGELLTIGGRHTFEFLEQRTLWNRSCITVENRHGKTSHERLPFVVAGTSGFGEHHGEVWGCHLGWSGNYELVCDAVTDGRRVIQAGELLLAGEIELAPGESYATPAVHGVTSATGLNAMSTAFHRHLRARPGHPSAPRPVHLNTWEAVYFNHDLPTLLSLADAAARVGVELFVLDDGWFGGRRDDRRGLGDWWVSPDAWPDGLAPLINHVRGLGMDFGIWVEPEMVNPDSDLYREHPDWALVDQRYPLVLGRNQLALDLGRAEVRDYLFGHLDALLRDHDIAYLKWDHNRDLVSPVSLGRAGVHRQIMGVYELLDRLRAAHPGVIIETCASGGGRVDFGILDRTDRVWVSDSIDALDRLSIQRGFSLLFPPELMGSHIGAPVTHTTKRTHRLGFRALVALFGAFGIEWNLLEASDDDIDHLAEIVELHKRFRPLLHGGEVFRADHPDPSVHVHGVFAGDRDEALLAVVRIASSATHHTAPVQVPGLDDDTMYELTMVTEVGEPLGHARCQPDWIDSKLVATGRQLHNVGFVAPQLFPENGILIHLRAVSRHG